MFYLQMGRGVHTAATPRPGETAALRDVQSYEFQNGVVPDSMMPLTRFAVEKMSGSFHIPSHRVSS